MQGLLERYQALEAELNATETLLDQVAHAMEEHIAQQRVWGPEDFLLEQDHALTYTRLEKRLFELLDAQAALRRYVETHSNRRIYCPACAAFTLQEVCPKCKVSVLRV